MTKCEIFAENNFTRAEITCASLLTTSIGDCSNEASGSSHLGSSRPRVLKLSSAAKVSLPLPLPLSTKQTLNAPFSHSDQLFESSFICGIVVTSFTLRVLAICRRCHRCCCRCCYHHCCCRCCYHHRYRLFYLCVGAASRSELRVASR